MSILKRLTAREAEAPKVESGLAFCEPAAATIYSKEHIREVGEEGRKYGGGVPNPALCGRDLRFGWDLQSEVSEERIKRGLEADSDGRHFLCAACGESALSLIAAARVVATADPVLMLAALIQQYDTVVDLHAAVSMDTPEDQALHDQAVKAAREAVKPFAAYVLARTGS